MSGVALVAGAGGAGAATAQALGDLGLHVVVVDSRAEAADLVVAALVASGASAEGHGIDLLDVDSVTALRDDLVSRLGTVDVLVHLVGGWRGSKTLELTSVENWDALHPPIVGTLAVLTAVFGAMVKESDRGRVIMVTSTAAARPTAGNIAYAAAKSAAEAWMKGVASFFEGSAAASVTIAVKALLTEAMVTEDPARAWPGYTHVRDLASTIASVVAGPAQNGSRLDLTTTEYSGA